VSIHLEVKCKIVGFCFHKKFISLLLCLLFFHFVFSSQGAITTLSCLVLGAS